MMARKAEAERMDVDDDARPAAPSPLTLNSFSPVAAMTMSSAAIVPSDTFHQPLQFKGEIMDFDLAGLEVDHRKR